MRSRANALSPITAFAKRPMAECSVAEPPTYSPVTPASVWMTTIRAVCRSLVPGGVSRGGRYGRNPPCCQRSIRTRLLPSWLFWDRHGSASLLGLRLSEPLITLIRMMVSDFLEFYVLNMPVISPVSSLRSISHALGFEGRPGKVMMLPARVTICLAPARTRSSRIGIVCPRGTFSNRGFAETDRWVLAMQMGKSQPFDSKRRAVVLVSGAPIYAVCVEESL